LAEVEFFRKQWNCGLGQKIGAVRLHPHARLFRGTNAADLEKALAGRKLLRSEARGKQMLFEFSAGGWLGVHLGMTGHLRQERPDFAPGRHDHLALLQKTQTLVFSDARQFGRVRFHHGPSAPDWWTRFPAPLTSSTFTLAVLETFLRRHGGLPIKAALLLQDGFPGVGNWMADEMLWRAGINPHTPSGNVQGLVLRRLWRIIRWVCRHALRVIGKDFSDPPAGWLMNEKWKRHGVCPITKRGSRKRRCGAAPPPGAFFARELRRPTRVDRWSAVRVRPPITGQGLRSVSPRQFVRLVGEMTRAVSSATRR